MYLVQEIYESLAQQNNKTGAVQTQAMRNFPLKRTLLMTILMIDHYRREMRTNLRKFELM